MSPVLFLFVIQAFVDTLNFLKIQPIQFTHFPKNKNGEFTTIEGRLLSQDTSAKRTLLSFNTYFYVMIASSYSLLSKNSNKPSKPLIRASPAWASSCTSDPKLKNPPFNKPNMTLKKTFFLKTSS